MKSKPDNYRKIGTYRKIPTKLGRDLQLFLNFKTTLNLIMKIHARGTSDNIRGVVVSKKIYFIFALLSFYILMLCRP